MDSKGQQENYTPYSPMPPQGTQFGTPTPTGYLPQSQPSYPSQPAYHPAPSSGYAPASPGYSQAPPGYSPSPSGYSPPPPGFASQYQPPSPQYNKAANVVVVTAPAVSTSTTVYRSTGDHYMTLSLVLTFLCFICGGWFSLFCTIPAILMASAAKGEEAAGRPVAAKQKSNVALSLNIAAIVIHVVIAIIVIVAATMSSIEAAVSIVSSPSAYCSYCTYTSSLYSCAYSYSYFTYSTYYTYAYYVCSFN